MEPAGLQPEPGQQHLSPRRARFRAAGAAHSESAETHGRNSRSHRAGESEPETLAAKFTPRPRSNRWQGAISLVREGLRPLLDQAPQMKKELATTPGKNGRGSGRIQNMAAKRSAPALRRRFPARGGQVPQETSVRARFRSIDGRDHEARASRSGGDANGDLRDRAAALQKIFPKRRPRQRWTTKRKSRRPCSTNWPSSIPTTTLSSATAQKIVREATEFVGSKNLVTVPDKPLEVIVMPEFKRGQGIAYCDSPGPLEKNGKTFFASSRPRKIGRKERKESFFREYNNYMCRDLTVHEAMPGHYLQLAHCQRIPCAHAGARDFPERHVHRRLGRLLPSR